MQIRNAIFSTLVLALVVVNQVSADPAASSSSSPPPRSDDEHKFVKREPRGGYHVHNHYHSSAPAAMGSGGGGGGLFGGGAGMGKTILGGTALAGGAAFAGTAGSIAAHRMFDKDQEGDDDSNNDGRGRGARSGGEGGDSQERQGGGVGGGSGVGGVQQPAYYTQTYPVGTTQQQQRVAPGPSYPIGILMSDGSAQPLPANWKEWLYAPDPSLAHRYESSPNSPPPQYAPVQPLQQGSGSSSPFVFPNSGR